MSPKKLSKEEQLKFDTLTGILKKIYENCGEESLKSFLASGGKDLPPVKLSPNEMKFISGGADTLLKTSYSTSAGGATVTIRYWDSNGDGKADYTTFSTDTAVRR